MRNDSIAPFVMVLAVFHHAWNTNGRYWLLPCMSARTIIWQVMSRFGIVNPNPVNPRFGELLVISTYAPFLKAITYGFALSWMVLLALAAAQSVVSW